MAARAKKRVSDGADDPGEWAGVSSAREIVRETVRDFFVDLRSTYRNASAPLQKRPDALEMKTEIPQAPKARRRPRLRPAAE